MPNHVRTDALGRQAWTSRNRHPHHLPKQVMHAVARQYIAAQAWKNARRAAAGLPLAPLLKDLRGFGPEGHAALLASFTVQLQVGGGAEANLRPAQAGDFRDPSAAV